ncbi:MAG: type II toxin-antitoxin system YafQ family toxin [Verrucomicrobia bacterium]|jgi:mRNA-degrading endonuclease YafQ of YafQ-DinJ toxin-antitoxin module|nr:type II toxin-antitoxin system YafQ family toxin [Verrucomicrobiota bacterium]
MTRIAFSSSFKRAFKKRIEGRKRLEESFWKRVEIFQEDPFDARLRTHKLSGDLAEFWSFSVEYNVRVLFLFATKNRVVFTDIGTHDEVY